MPWLPKHRTENDCRLLLQKHSEKNLEGIFFAKRSQFVPEPSDFSFFLNVGILCSAEGVQHSGQAVREGALSACREGRVLINSTSAPGRAVISAGDLIIVRLPSVAVDYTSSSHASESPLVTAAACSVPSVSTCQIAEAPRRRMVLDRASLASQLHEVAVCS